MARYVKWEEVLKLEDWALINCLIMTSSEKTLDIIEQGAPYLFSRRKPKSYAVPLSMLRKREKLNRLREQDVEYTEDCIVSDTCDYFYIPYIRFLHPEDEDLKPGDIGLDLETYERVDKPFEFGQTVIVNEKNFIIISPWPDFGSYENTWGFAAIPAERIDLNK
jgi:hypothetical protein